LCDKNHSAESTDGLEGSSDWYESPELELGAKGSFLFRDIEHS
jgi:hypothetical protein